MNYLANGYTMDGHMYGGAVWGWLFMLTLLAAAIVVIIAAVRYLSGNRENDGKQETALDILNKRYAKGEIGKKEYQELKQDITT